MASAWPGSPYLQPFQAADKWIGNAEYSLALSQFCPSDNSADMNGILFSPSLDGGAAPAVEQALRLFPAPRLQLACCPWSLLAHSSPALPPGLTGGRR